MVGSKVVQFRQVSLYQMYVTDLRNEDHMINDAFESKVILSQYHTITSITPP